MWDVILALALAVLFDWKGLLPKAIADRLAAVLVVFAFAAVLVRSLAANTLLDVGQRLSDGLGGIVGHFTSPEAAQAVGKYGLAVGVIFVAALWIGAMLPGETARKFGGDITSREMSSWDIWGGGLALTVGAFLVPGLIGDALRYLVGVTAVAGQSLVGLVS